MARTIAVLSFLPDAGHVFPLLRVAAAFARRQHEVVCYLPEECRSYLKGYDFRYVSLGPAFDEASRDAYRQMLASLSRERLLYTAVAGPVQLWKMYWEPLMSHARGQMTSVRSRLAEEKPLFLLCDGDHIFDELYSSLAQDLNTPVVLHTFEGHRWNQNFYVHTYGVSRLPAYLQSGLSRAMRASGSLVRAGLEFQDPENLRLRVQRRLSRFPRRSLGWLYKRSVGRFVKGEGAEKDPSPSDHGKGSDATLEPLAIASGSGYLEQAYLGSELKLRNGTKRFFGPLKPPPTIELSPDLKEWLLQKGEAVVYVSFGSMVHLDPEFVRSVLAGLSMLKLRVLWSMPKAQQDKVLTGRDVESSVRFVTFVPPLEVLSLPTVRCGINHGGAGSVQDCLISGKPMLVIPFMWDQPYNGSVVSRLGVGKRLWKTQVSARSIAKSIEQLVYDERFAARAASLAAEIEDYGTESKVVDYVLRQPSIRGRATETTVAE